MGKMLVGIDEVGRGCLAGPVSVGAVVIYSGRRIPVLNEIKCSKQLSSLKRKEWREWARQKEKEGKIKVAVSHIEPSYIDKYGITAAIQKALNNSLNGLSVDKENTRVLLDGGLKAPSDHPYQKTIIKGDEKDSVISLASAVAKVERDELMERYSCKYPQYGFERHKGYGTKHHREMIGEYGPCKIHRQSFLSSHKLS